MHRSTIRNVEAFIRLPATAAFMFCMSGCTGTTYFVKEKDHQRYYASEIGTYLFDDDEEAAYSGLRRSADQGEYRSAGMRSHARFRDSNVIGHLYYDPDGENRGQQPYALTIRRDYRSYNAETALTEPIEVGKHKMTPHLSLGRHRDHNLMAGIVMRMPF